MDTTEGGANPPLPRNCNRVRKPTMTTGMFPREGRASRTIRKPGDGPASLMYPRGRVRHHESKAATWRPFLFGGSSVILMIRSHPRHQQPIRRPAQLLVLALVSLGSAVLTGCPPKHEATLHRSTPLDRVGESLPEPETWPRTFPSAQGPDIVLQRPPRSIVTLQPNIAEMLASIGAAGHVTGVDRYTDYPPDMARKPRIGDILSPDYEQILSINPDLIITSRGTSTEVLAKLRGFGFQVLGIDPQSLSDIFSCMKMFGRIVGTEEQVDEIVGKMQRRATQIADSAGAAAKIAGRPRTVFVLSMDPLFVAGEGSFIAQLIRDAGGLHVISVQTPAGEPSPWPQVSRETLVTAAPQVLIFASQQAGQSDADRGEALLARLRDDPAWAQLPAVADGRVYIIEDDLITIPGPRLLLGFDRLIRCIQPDADMKDSPEAEAIYREAGMPHSTPPTNEPHPINSLQ